MADDAIVLFRVLEIESFLLVRFGDCCDDVSGGICDTAHGNVQQ